MLDRRRMLKPMLVVGALLVLAGPAMGDVIWDLQGKGKAQIKTKGFRVREKFPEQVRLTLADDGTFTTDVIVSGTWSQGKGNKVEMTVSEADMAAIAASYGDRLGGVTIELTEVSKFRLRSIINANEMMKINLKLDGLVTVPELGLVDAKVKIRGFYKGYGSPVADPDPDPVGGGDLDPIPEPATLLLLGAGAVGLIRRRR